MNCRCPRPLPNLQPGFEAALAGSITRRKMMLLCDSKQRTPHPSGPGQLHLTDQVWVEIGGSSMQDQILFPGSWVHASERA